MASSPLVQVPHASVDAPGLSISTSPKLPADPRQGSAYDLGLVAAAVPVHFHHMSASALGGDNFMMLMSQRWGAATVSGTDPGFFSAATIDQLPSWVMINAATGIVSSVNSGTEIPIATPGQTLTLVGAVSRGTDMLYTLTKATTDGVSQAVVNHFHNNTAINTLNPIGEEIIPKASNGPDTVVFTAGLQYSKATDPYMHFYGTGSASNAVYMARKPWAHVGNVGVPTAPLLVDWEFFTGTGWSGDPSTARPLQTDTGATMLTVGPMSFANLALPRRHSGKTTNYTLCAVVTASGTARDAQVYASLGGRPWSALGAPVPLGHTGSGPTYLGGTLQFQSQLGINPTAVDPGSATAVPYVISTAVGTTGHAGIDVAWDALQIPVLA